MKYWPIISFVVINAAVVLVWLIRLEGKVKKQNSDIEKHEKEIDGIKSDNKEEIRDINRKLDNMATELTKICVSFSELSGYIKGKECRDEKP